MYKTKITIAFMGAGVGVGTTHAALSVAYYLADILKAKTALVEIGSNRSISALSEYAEDTFEELSAFLREGIFMFPGASEGCITGILNSDFEYVVLDITDNEKSSVEEFLRADLQFMVCSFSEWRMNDLKECLVKIASNFNIREIKTVTSMKENKRKKTTPMKSRLCSFNLETYVIPFIADPFNPEKSHMGFFKELLNCT